MGIAQVNDIGQGEHVKIRSILHYGKLLEHEIRGCDNLIFDF